jgi:hypothetical protein
MSLVTLRFSDPNTLHFTIHRPKIQSYEEMMVGYNQYNEILIKAQKEKRKLHVIIHLEAINRVDFKLWSYAHRMYKHDQKVVRQPGIVTQVTIILPFKIMRPVVNALLPYCVGPGTKVVIQ